MCIAVAIKAGTDVTEGEVRAMQRRNGDGMGFAYNHEGEVFFYKNMDDVDAFYACYKSSKEKYPLAHFVMHFRLATHGQKNLENCHPYIIHSHGTTLAFIHNGIFNGESPREDLGMSDSFWFGENVLKNLPEKFYRNDGILELLDAHVARRHFSKLVILSSDGDLVIVGAKRGEWDAGRWFSNGGFRQWNATTAMSTTMLEYSCVSCGKTVHTSHVPEDGTCWACLSARCRQGRLSAVNA